VGGALKVSNSTLGILVAGVVVIALVYLLFTYYNQGNEHDSLSLQIATDTRTAAGLDAQKVPLQTKKTQVSDQLALAKTVLDQAGASNSLPLESIAYGEELFKTADTFQVQIVNLAISKPSLAKIDNLNYRVMDINLDINGQMDGIAGFIQTLTNGPSFGGVSIGNISISQMNSATAQPHLHVSLRAYQYSGA
jgi:hypothetical protein